MLRPSLHLPVRPEKAWDTLTPLGPCHRPAQTAVARPPAPRRPQRWGCSSRWHPVPPLSGFPGLQSKEKSFSVPQEASAEAHWPAAELGPWVLRCADPQPSRQPSSRKVLDLRVVGGWRQGGQWRGQWRGGAPGEKGPRGRGGTEDGGHREEGAMGEKGPQGRQGPEEA